MICSVIFKDRYVLHFQHCRFYAQLGDSEWTALMLRLAAYLSAIIVGASFMAVVPKKHGIITEIGANSLYVYLLHLPVMNVLRYSRALSPIDNPYFFWGVIAVSILAAFVLSRDIVKRASAAVVDPFSFWPAALTAVKQTVPRYMFKR